jgi:hypothetical protein
MDLLKKEIERKRKELEETKLLVSVDIKFKKKVLFNMLTDHFRQIKRSILREET